MKSDAKDKTTNVVNEVLIQDEYISKEGDPKAKTAQTKQAVLPAPSTDDIEVNEELFYSQDNLADTLLQKANQGERRGKEEAEKQWVEWWDDEDVGKDGDGTPNEAMQDGFLPPQLPDSDDGEEEESANKSDALKENKEEAAAKDSQEKDEKLHSTDTTSPALPSSAVAIDPVVEDVDQEDREESSATLGSYTNTPEKAGLIPKHADLSRIIEDTKEDLVSNTCSQDMHLIVNNDFDGDIAADDSMLVKDISQINDESLLANNMEQLQNQFDDFTLSQHDVSRN